MRSIRRARGVSPALAKEVRDEFYPKQNIDPAGIRGLGALSADTVTFKFLPQPLRPDPLSALVPVPGAPR